MSNKEETRSPSVDNAAWRAESNRLATRLRERAKTLGSTKRESLRQLEARLTERLQALAEELAREQATAAERESSLARRSQELEEHAAERESALNRRSQELDEQAAEVALRQEDLHTRLSQGEVRLAERKAELEHWTEEVRRKDQACTEREKELMELARRQNATREQRRRLARELRAKRSQLLAEIEQKRAELLQAASGEESQVQRQLLEQLAECGRLRDQLAESERKHAEMQHAATGEESQLQRQVMEQMAECGRLRELLAQGERQRSELEARLRDSQVASAADEETALELEDVRRNCQVLKERLASSEQRCQEAERRCSEAEHQLAEQPPASDGNEQELEDLRRRWEMALQDVRDLKSQNAELQRELETRRRPAATNGKAGDAIMGGDWESQKKRLMQQLEEDFDPKIAEEAKDKSFVEEAVRLTDQVVAEKDREIQELQRLLNDQSSNIGGLAVGATAIAAVLDQDELIREEREALKRLQDEWREKLRQSEVAISVERAKVARERLEVEEKQRQLAAAAKHAPASGEPGSDSTKKTRRWLSLLMKEGEGK